jgi:hypothetical protein
MASDGTASDGTAGDALEPAAQIVEARDAASHALLATATSDARGAVRFARLPTVRGLDLLLPQLGAAAPPLRRALELELERDAAAAGDVDLGPLRMKRE